MGGLLSFLSWRVLLDSVKRLSPVYLVSNPVMLIVELTFFIVTAMAIYPPAFYPVASSTERLFYVEIALILLITVWFSTLSDSLAETQARMTANSLREMEAEVVSKKITTERGERKDRPDKVYGPPQGRLGTPGKGGCHSN